MATTETVNLSDAPSGGSSHPRWRRFLAALCIVVSCICAPLTVTAVWLRNQVLDTDRYVDTVAPLASNQAIIDAVAADITETLFTKIDAQAEIKDALPKRAEFLAGPMAAGLRQLTEQVALKALESEKFQDLWASANRLAHQELDNVLTGGGDVVSTKDGKVVLDLSSVFDQVRQLLKKRGVGIFTDISKDNLTLKFQLFDAQQLGKVQTAVSLLDTIASWMPFITLGLLLIGTWLSANRRRTVIRWGIGSAFALAVLAALIGVGRLFYLEGATSAEFPRDAAAAAFDTVVRFLRQGLRYVLALAIVVALAAWVTGPGKVPTRVRTTFRDVFGGLGDRAEARGWDFGAFGQFVARYANPLRIGGVAVLLLTLLLAERNSATRLLVFVLALLVYLAAVQFVARAAKVDGETPAAES
ncbi:MAG: hypothetical protein FJW88_01660 [Actinobacteria bacterium]|nr:hypothetical protein [Actinomycetota bacterium]